MWLSIDEKDARPIYQQIIGQVRSQVAGGALKAGDELPSVRELAGTLGINMHTVRSAYLKLRDQGIISLRLGRRARVTAESQRSENAQTALDWQKRMRETVTDALLSGASADDIRRAVERELGQSAKKAR
jgi:DNA-binding transcriptional regulator YhcF (GntR family)